MRNLLKLLPVALLALVLVGGCAKPAPPPPNSAPTPQQFAKADPSITRGATGAILFFLNNRLGWTAVNLETHQPPAGAILHTSDGGQTWIQLNSPGLVVIRQLAFADAQHGWTLVSSDAGNNRTLCAIMATGDGGQTWNQQWSQEMTQDGRQYRLQILSDKDGFALLGDIFLATADGGLHWIQRSSGQTMESFSFTDRLSGWATGANSIWHTADGGISWTKQWTVPDKIKSEFIYSTGMISFVSPTSGWALFQGDAAMSKTTKLVLYTDDGGSNWSTTSTFLPGNQTNFPVNDAPHYRTARFIPVNATTALLAASPPTNYPVLYRTSDHGVNWETLSDGMSAKPGLPKGAWGDLSFVSDSEGWAAVITQTPAQTGSSNTVNNVALLHTRDGGKTWTTQFP